MRRKMNKLYQHKKIPNDRLYLDRDGCYHSIFTKTVIPQKLVDIEDLVECDMEDAKITMGGYVCSGFNQFEKDEIERIVNN
jgi:hypothetical protein